MAVSDRALEAIVTGAAGTATILALRWTLGHAMGGYLARAETRREPDDVARLRTRLSVLQRAIVAFLFAILAWQVLAIFPTTSTLANTLLASGAVLALLVGLAFTAPLGNLGGGILLALTQPVRLGDRVTVGEATGTVEQITLVHTVLLTDEDLRIFIPNGQMVGSTIVNRTVKDPRRQVTVRLPVSLRAPIDRARAVVIDAARGVEDPAPLELLVRLDEVGEHSAWLGLVAYAPLGTDVAALAGELRERAVTALAREDLLPA
jgi:small conductance mechanosensitive channel